MAKIILSVPDGSTCDGCAYKIRRTDVEHLDYHCAIFGSRADKKCRKCVEASTQKILSKMANI